MQRILVLKRLSVTENAIFNSAGATIYCICQWAVTMIAVRLSGDYENAGILQLSISIASVFYTIACYVPRTYQISDVSGEYSAGEYSGMRIASCSLAALLCLAYAAISGYRGKVLACIVVYMIFKLTEGISDLLRTHAQINRRMDYEFNSYVIRGLLSLAVFTVSMYFTGDVLASVSVMTVLSAIAVAVYDTHVARKFTDASPKFNLKIMKKAAIECLPISLAAFAITSYSAVPRQFLEKMQGTEALGYYATVAAPVVFVQLLATTVFNPMLTEFTDFYAGKNTDGIKKLFYRITADILGLTVIAFAGARILGEYAYVFIYGEPIREYCTLMYAVIACSVIYAVSWLTGNILIIMRKQKIRLIYTLAGLAAAVILGQLLVAGYGMSGVSYAVFVSHLLCSAASSVSIAAEIRRMKNA